MSGNEPIAGTLFDPLAYGAYFDGTRDDSAALLRLAGILTDANGPTKGSGGTLVLSGKPTIAATMSLPASVDLFVLPGTRATAASGVTVTVNGVTTGSEPSATSFAGAGTWTFVQTPAIAGGNVTISSATPQAETFGAAGAAGSTGNVSDAGHVHPLSGTAGGALTGTYPNPTIASGAALNTPTLTQPTVISDIITGAGGHTPGVSALTALGTSPPAPVLAGNQAAGRITFGTGTSPTTGDAVRFTFDHAKTAFRILLTPANAATAALGIYHDSATDGANYWNLGLQNAPAASQGATVYAFNYWIFY